MPRKPYTRQPDSNRPGRPHVITEAVQQRIVEYLTAGGTVESFCKKNKHIVRTTVFNFMASESGAKFRDAVHRAREYGTHAIAENVLTIVDDPDIDPLRARIRADVRLRLIAQWNRKHYGVKQDIDINARLTLGELVEAAMKERPAMLDITPAAPQITAAPAQQPLPASAAAPSVQPARARRAAAR